MASEAEIESAATQFERLTDMWPLKVRMACALLAAERVRWQLIETAPKYGDLMLCASSPKEVRMSTGRWAEGYWLWGHEEEPTHWQPLPDPPK